MEIDHAQTHAHCLTWAQEQGIKCDGIEPATIAGRGSGIVATRKLSAGEVVAYLPIKALYATKNVSTEVRIQLTGTTVHGILAASLALEAGLKTVPYGPWRAVWPSKRDFEESMPIMWSSDAQNLLPPFAKELLQAQKQKLETDTAEALHKFPKITGDDYTFHWLIVNTRTFYYVPPGAKKKPPAADCMALCPFTDYFNHSDIGCPVSFDTIGYTIRCDRDYAAGDELYISYGNHSNDFLLVEYGFLLQTNTWDELRLDHLLLQEFTAKQKDQLKQAGFLGNYVLDRDQVCYRTQVAVRLLILPRYKWQRFVHGKDDGGHEQGEVDAFIVRLLQRFLDETVESLSKVDALPQSGPKTLLQKRWLQIRDILTCRIEEMVR
ncbi:SET domain-containing protein [Xylona heveae TC161]|uniref:SET domain-containing protein n=1 Tax=Xylona heveae (strain CBS 132557 / TC161) TaxID=1328760 RepID=A0A165AI29_XYLHT|nr:SET domain-containing protein [Xylona heveae TC161]KZF20512.1 SET domain-containing protein [Xylona heveae TC161]